MMAGCRGNALYASAWLYQYLAYVTDMTKKYQIVRDKIPTASGGFVEALRMALVEFSCLGETRFDISGYPHASEVQALATDWERLGQDALEATRKFRHNLDSDGFDNIEEYKTRIVRLRAELANLEEKAREAARMASEAQHGGRGRATQDAATSAGTSSSRSGGA